MIKVYEKSGSSLKKLLEEIPEEIEKNIISISHEKFFEESEEYDEDSDEYLEVRGTYYKITVFYKQ